MSARAISGDGDLDHDERGGGRNGGGGARDGGGAGGSGGGAGDGGGSAGATDGGASEGGACQPTSATTCAMPGLFVAPGQGEVILTPGDVLLEMEQSGVGEAWFTLGLSATNMSADITPHVSAEFTLGVRGGDDYTLELYCTSCGGKLIDRSAHAPSQGVDGETVSYYKGQTSPSGLTGERLYVHVLPVQISTCAQWSMVVFTEEPKTGFNCT
jgi:hypothetical protein